MLAHQLERIRSSHGHSGWLFFLGLLASAHHLRRGEAVMQHYVRPGISTDETR
jgi:hypothetical protein